MRGVGEVWWLRGGLQSIVFILFFLDRIRLGSAKNIQKIGLLLGDEWD